MSGTPTSSLGCPDPGGINLSHRVGVGSSLKNLKRKLVSGTLASDPEALRTVRKMNPETWARTNHWSATGVMGDRPSGKPFRERG